MTEGGDTPREAEWDNIVRSFMDSLRDDPDLAVAVASIRALTLAIRRSKAETIMGLTNELKRVIEILKNTNPDGGTTEVCSGCELFMQFVTKTHLDTPDFNTCKDVLIERGERYGQMSISSRQKIAHNSQRFISDGAVILAHGYSRVVLQVLIEAAKRNVNFHVIVTESRPDNSWRHTVPLLVEHGIPVTFIFDAGVSVVMDRVSMVLVGAEGVVENGGIVNKIGTYQIAIVARSLKKPFYVVAESYKFLRTYPLTQQDLSLLKLRNHKIENLPEIPSSVKLDPSSHDYTPPSLITLLFTDLGVLTPSAVSDELIKLYY